MTDTIALPVTPYLRGVAAGNRIAEVHGTIEFPNFDVRREQFWFMVGGLAVEQGLSTAEDLSLFAIGASTRKPSPPVMPSNLSLMSEQMAAIFVREAERQSYAGMGEQDNDEDD